MLFSTLTRHRNVRSFSHRNFFFYLLIFFLSCVGRDSYDLGKHKQSPTWTGIFLPFLFSCTFSTTTTFPHFIPRRTIVVRERHTCKGTIELGERTWDIKKVCLSISAAGPSIAAVVAAADRRTDGRCRIVTVAFQRTAEKRGGYSQAWPIRTGLPGRPPWMSIVERCLETMKKNNQKQKGHQQG